MSENIILSLENVTKEFTPKAPPAVNQVTLDLNRGNILGLLGPSGCGKTTLLRTIAGFEKPNSGTIIIEKQQVAAPGIWVPPERRNIGMVFQDYALFPHLKVFENVAFGLRNSANKAPVEVKKRVAEVLELVGLREYQTRYPHELSGGQQQRVALARALAPRPSIVLLDEPLSNLDVQVRLRLREELQKILKAAGISAIFVTHDHEEALSLSDRIAVIQNGILKQYCTPEELYREPTCRFVAEFVTQANFIPAKFQDRMWQTELGNFSVDRILKIENSENNLHKADLMVRQEELIVEPEDNANVVICGHQFLGREHLYYLQTPSGKELIARTSSDRLIPLGTRVKVSVASPALRLFPERA